MKLFKSVFLKLLIYFRLYPHIFFVLNPFKIYEFVELLNGIEFSKEDEILDIGCGDGLVTMLLGKKCKKIIGIDISEKSICTSKTRSHYMGKRINIEFICNKIETVKFENECFNKIVSFCVIEHIVNYNEVLQEAYRTLKKDGQMLFSVDALETIQYLKLLEKHKKQHFVEQYFKKEELNSILEEIGFKEIEIYPIFKSKFAKRLFIKGINNNFHFGFFYSILTYGLLKFYENMCTDENKGIFLIAKCKK